MSTPPPLAPVDESWDRALAVVAHPDDMEFGAAAAVARWTAQGKTVVYCMVTSGEAGIDSMDPDRCREVREREQVDSARVVGVDVMDTDVAALRTLIAVGAHYPVVVDQDGRTRGSLGWSSGTPVTLLVSSGGVIVERIVGRAPDEATLRRLVEDDLGVQLQG